MAAGALGAGEPVVAQLVDGALAELAGMLLAHCCSEAHGHRHPDSFIINVEAQVCHAWSLHPSGGRGGATAFRQWGQDFLFISFTLCSTNFSVGNNIALPHSLISAGASCPHCPTVAPPKAV